MTDAHAGGPRIHLRFADCGIEVSSAAEADLAWLAAFLECGFEATAPQPCDHRVDLVVDPRSHEDLLRAREPSARSGRWVDGFAGDSRSRRFQPWGSAGAMRLYRDPRDDVFHRVSPGARHAQVVARERTPRARRAWMRVVRELAMARVVSRGAVLMHAAAVSHGGRIVAIAGPKRTGKTTLLLSLLRHTGAAYVANDRCALLPGETGVALRGIPTRVSIRADTLGFFPSAFELLEPMASDRLRLDPPALCAGLAAAREPGGRLAALVFPRVVDRSDAGLRLLESAEAIGRLRAGRFRASRPRLLGEVFAPPAADAPGAFCESAWERSLVASLPCFEYRLARGAAPEAQACRELLEAVA